MTEDKKDPDYWLNKMCEENERHAAAIRKIDRIERVMKWVIIIVGLIAIAAPLLDHYLKGLLHAAG